MSEKIWEIKVVKPFLKHMEKAKPKAHRLYTFAFKDYVEWLRKEYGIEKDVEELTLEDMKPAWIESYINDIPNPHTANSYLSAFKSLFKFVQKEFIPKSMEEFIYITQYFKGIDSIKCKERPERFSSGALTEVEVARLLDVLLENEKMYHITIVHAFFGSRPVELAQKYKEVSIDLNHVDDLVKAYGRALIDFDSKLICIPTAKSKTRFKLVPFDVIEESINVWYNHLDEIVNYSKDRGNEWYTKHIKTYAKKAELKVTAYTWRYTLRTLMAMRVDKEWMINYWLGHGKEKIPEIYRDYRVLLPFLKENFVAKHYLLTLI